MSERKYTDEEIINKMSAYIEMSCRMCGFKALCNNLCAIEFIKEALKAALGLIKRQKSDVDKLQEVNADLNESLRLAAEVNKDLKAEVERLTRQSDILRGAANSYKMRYEKAKAEAIKAFADRLKQRKYGINWYGDDVCYIVEANEIDNLVAEMTEGK